MKLKNSEEKAFWIQAFMTAYGCDNVSNEDAAEWADECLEMFRDRISPSK